MLTSKFLLAPYKLNRLAQQKLFHRPVNLLNIRAGRYGALTETSNRINRTRRMSKYYENIPI